MESELAKGVVGVVLDTLVNSVGAIPAFVILLVIPTWFLARFTWLIASRVTEQDRPWERWVLSGVVMLWLLALDSLALIFVLL